MCYSVAKYRPIFGSKLRVYSVRLLLKIMYSKQRMCDTLQLRSKAGGGWEGARADGIGQPPSTRLTPGT